MQSLPWIPDSTSCCAAERDTAVEGPKGTKRLYSVLQLVEYCTHILPDIVAGKPSGNRAE